MLATLAGCDTDPAPHDAWAPHAPGLKSIEDAQVARAGIAVLTG